MANPARHLRLQLTTTRPSHLCLQRQALAPDTRHTLTMLATCIHLPTSTIFLPLSTFLLPSSLALSSKLHISQMATLFLHVANCTFTIQSERLNVHRCRGAAAQELCGADAEPTVPWGELHHPGLRADRYVPKHNMFKMSG